MGILSGLPRNARNSIKVEPLWAVFGGMIFFYVPLYMKEIGLTEVEMGIINTINLFVSFVCHFFAGPITNRLGRKKTTLIFDLISWTIPMFIWTVAQNFWYFLAASIINAFVRIVFVSWYCLLTEDTPQDKRARVFGIIYVINYAAGIFTPITGFFAAKYGIVPTMRIIYALGLLSMTSMFLIRNALVSETQAGRDIMKYHSELSILQSIRSYILTIMGAFKNKSLIPITLIYIVTNFIISLNFFQVLFLKEHLKFSEEIVSITPGVSAFINVLLYMFVVPRLNKYPEEKALTAALATGLSGALMFLFIPNQNISMLILTVAILAVGNFITQTYRDSVFMNKIGEHEKADVFSAVQTLTTLVCVPSGYIAGFLYSISPLLPFIMISILFAAALLVSFLLLSNNKASVNISEQLTE